MEPADPLWQRLKAHRIGPDDAELTFTRRLARENRWSADYAERVVEEYRRFAYLAVTAGHEVTPSDPVDQAWHLHLTYSRDYWQRFCPEVLQCALHHGPTAGTSADRERFYSQYAETLRSYEQRFGEPPPADIWSPAARRFDIDPLAFRVNPRDAIIVPRRRVPAVLGAGLLALLAVFCLGLAF